ncbi:unnamed protein product [Scytosiphon promiscuus]
MLVLRVDDHDCCGKRGSQLLFRLQICFEFVDLCRHFQTVQERGTQRDGPSHEVTTVRTTCLHADRRHIKNRGPRGAMRVESTFDIA